MFTVSEVWKAAYPGASAGILMMRDVTNPGQHAELDRRKGELEGALRSRFAGHDLAAIESSVQLDVAQGDERYTLLNGREQALKAGDMLRCPEPVEGMADRQGVISSVLYGPDRRTRITSTTTRVFFAVYAPAGIEEQAVYQHLADIQANVEIVAPDAEVVSKDVYGTEHEQ